MKRKMGGGSVDFVAGPTTVVSNAMGNRWQANTKFCKTLRQVYHGARQLQPVQVPEPAIKL